MARSPGTGKKSKAESKPKRTKTATPNLETLQKTKTAGRQQYGRPQRTRKNYDSYIERGKEFLKDLVSERKKEEKANRKPTQDSIDTKTLARAFDESGPNRLSAVALELFLTQKCLTENRGMSTAEGIRSAFADYWDNLDGDKYAGEYKYNETTSTITGCPARASIVKSFMKVVLAKDGAKGAAATRHHAEAMRIEDLAHMMSWSEQQVPSTTVGQRLRSIHQLQTEGRYLMLKHVMMRAFLSSGFTLWTRNFELCGLQRRNLEMDCIGGTPLHLPFFKVRLENRKGWQNKQGWNGPLENNTYHIYQQPKWPLDMYTHLRLWIVILEQELGRSLAPDDYIFPFISSNGLIDPRQAMSHDVVQGLLSEFSIGSGLDKHFTTHSLRRGGAQYRLMYAPLGERWSLAIIRWWGGWAIGEKVDTLMKYLIDSLQSFENGYNDALCPTRVDPSKTFLGEGDLLRAATVHDLHTLATAIVSTIRTASSMSPCNTPSPYQHGAQTTILPNTREISSTSATVATDSPSSFFNENLVNGNTAVLRPAVGIENVPSLSKIEKKQKLKHHPPIPGIFIPNLGRTKGSWRDAVTQWEEGDPSIGLVALKHWPREWYSGVMRTKTGMKRHLREMIANEYQRLGRDDAEFEALYADVKGQSGLIKAIRMNQSDYKTRSSKKTYQHQSP